MIKSELHLKGTELANVLSAIECRYRKGQCGGIYLALRTRDNDIWYLTLKSFTGINIKKITNVEVLMKKHYVDVFVEAVI